MPGHGQADQRDHHRQTGEDHGRPGGGRGPRRRLLRLHPVPQLVAVPGRDEQRVVDADRQARTSPPAWAWSRRPRSARWRPTIITTEIATPEQRGDERHAGRPERAQRDHQDDQGHHHAERLDDAEARGLVVERLTADRRRSNPAGPTAVAGSPRSGLRVVASGTCPSTRSNRTLMIAAEESGEIRPLANSSNGDVTSRTPSIRSYASAPSSIACSTAASRTVVPGGATTIACAVIPGGLREVAVQGVQRRLRLGARHAELLVEPVADQRGEPDQERKTGRPGQQHRPATAERRAAETVQERRHAYPSDFVGVAYAVLGMNTLMYPIQFCIGTRR